MRLNKILTGMFAALLVFSFGCKKTEFDTNVRGEALGDFRLVAPATSVVLPLNAATPNAAVTISWTAAPPGLVINPKYTWVAAIKGVDNIDQPRIEVPSNNGGNATSLTLTFQQIDQALAAKGIAPGVTTEFLWSVVADNGTTKRRSQDVFSITLTRMSNGSTPFVLLSPASSTNVNEIDPSSTAQSFVFRWTRSTPATGSPNVTYRVLFTNNNNFGSPLFTMVSNGGGTDTTVSLTYKAMSDSLTAKGLTDFGQAANLKWTVVATSGTWQQRADYVNDLVIVRQVRMFLVGDLTGWDINNPFELVADKGSGRLGKVFYTYIKVNTTAQFLFIKERGNWGSKYGITGGAAPTFNIGYNTGSDFFIGAPGIYRLTIDAGTMKAHIQQKQVGLVGAFQGWNPGSPVNGGFIQRDKFIILQNISLGDEFKFHDGPVWDNSAPDKARWWGKSGGGGNLDNDGNGPNLNNETGVAGLVRCIWDGTNPQQVRYSMNRGQLRIVGSLPVVGSWNPDNALDMNYMGNGVWQRTLTLPSAGEFKFVSASGWSFNYGDAGGGRIVENGGNLNRGAGTYTITVDEYNRTFTVL
ncbi:MAG: hypothetical protein RJA57_117 [Bacteroidota bacterium]